MATNVTNDRLRSSSGSTTSSTEVRTPEAHLDRIDEILKALEESHKADCPERTASSKNLASRRLQKTAEDLRDVMSKIRQQQKATK